MYTLIITMEKQESDTSDIGAAYATSNTSDIGAAYATSDISSTIYSFVYCDINESGEVVPGFHVDKCICGHPDCGSYNIGMVEDINGTIHLISNIRTYFNNGGYKFEYYAQEYLPPHLIEWINMVDSVFYNKTQTYFLTNRDFTMIEESINSKMTSHGEIPLTDEEHVYIEYKKHIKSVVS